MDKEVNLKDAIFSILFTCGDPVKKVALQETFGIGHEVLITVINEINAVLVNLPLMLKETEETLYLVTRPEMSDYVKKFRTNGQSMQRLSDPSLETLAIVIMKQPCTRQEIESVRGCDCERTLNTLIKAKLIKPVGSLKTPGFPALYSITDECLHRFGVKSYSELKAIIENSTA